MKKKITVEEDSFKVSGEELLKKIKELIKEGNIREITIENKEGRVITAELENFFLVNVYVPNSGTNQDYRKAVWDKAVYKFLRSMKGRKKPIIYCGDLNVVSGENDIYNPEIIERGRSPGVKPLNVLYEKTHGIIFKSIL